MSIRTLSIFTAVLFLLPVQSTNGQESLRWKFRSQENIKYNVVQNMKTSMKIGDNNVNQTMNQSMDMSWQILSVAASGDTVMNQVVDRIRMKSEGGPAGLLEFDTADAKKPENPIIASMGETFQKIVNKPFTVTMKPDGQIDNVTVPPELIDAIRQSSAGNAAALNEDSLKQMMKQSAVTLPDGPVVPNNTWTSQQSIELPFGTMQINSTMTYAGKDAMGNALINVVPKISVTPKEGAPVKMTLTNSDGRGQVTFNIIQGRVSKSRLDLTMAMKIETANGQTFDQTIQQATEMTLVQ